MLRTEFPVDVEVESRLPSPEPAWLARFGRTGTAAAVLVAIWAVLYLPRLGTPELQGEEPRRIFPAMAMLYFTRP